MSEQRTSADLIAAKPATPDARPGSKLPALALVAALAALGSTGYQWHQDRGADSVLRSELAQRLAEMEAQNKGAAARVQQAAEVLRETETKVGELEAKLAESQNQQVALEALYQELSRSRDEWAFADIEQSVLLASQQLQIAANVRTALIALENVEARLQRMEQSRYSALRRALARDIERLKTLPLVDVYGTGARLDDAIAAIDRLPLAMDARARSDDTADAPAPAAELPAWERVMREAWRELRQLVRVQSSGVQDAALLAPEQAFFLRENLKLRLLGARIALLSRDGKSYQGDLQAALTALERHFDVRDGTVTTTAATLRRLQAARVQIDLPDLQETLDALRKLHLPRGKGSA